MIFVDTGAFLARYLPRDQYHRKAVTGWDQIRRKRVSTLTTNFVLDETLTLLGRKADYAFAAERARNIYNSEALTILRPVYEDEIEAIGYFEKYADQQISFTDCVSFVMMRKEGLRRAFTFDKHFSFAGFDPWP